MMSRRTFLETATTVTAATLLANKFSWAAGQHKIDKVGVQLYTVAHGNIHVFLSVVLLSVIAGNLGLGAGAIRRCQQ